MKNKQTNDIYSRSSDRKDNHTKSRRTENSIDTKSFFRARRNDIEGICQARRIMAGLKALHQNLDIVGIPQRDNFRSEDQYRSALKEYLRTFPAPKTEYSTFIGLDGEMIFYPDWLLALIWRYRLATGPDKPKILERDKETGLWRILPAVVSLLNPILDIPIDWAEENRFENNSAEYPLLRDLLVYGCDVYIYYIIGVAPRPVDPT